MRTVKLTHKDKHKTGLRNIAKKWLQEKILNYFQSLRISSAVTELQAARSKKCG